MMFHFDVRSIGAEQNKEITAAPSQLAVGLRQQFVSLRREQRKLKHTFRMLKGSKHLAHDEAE